MYINPVVTVIGLAALFARAGESRSRSSLGALSGEGLAFQAVVFAVVALDWPRRMTTHSVFWEMVPWWAYVTWCQLLGWAAVDSAVFAFVQAVLLWVVRRRRGEV